MEILCLGLSHHTAPIEVRERFAIPDGELRTAAAELARASGVGEALIVSTCNRVEFYVAAENAEHGFAAVHEFVAAQYAVEVLHVEHVIVCGHYGCGGVRSAFENKELGLVDNWLRHIRDVYQEHRGALEEIQEETHRLDRLCELNVIKQLYNVCHTTIVQNAWRRCQPLVVHGWIYRYRMACFEI